MTFDHFIDTLIKHGFRIGHKGHDWHTAPVISVYSGDTLLAYVLNMAEYSTVGVRVHAPGHELFALELIFPLSILEDASSTPQDVGSRYLSFRTKDGHPVAGIAITLPPVSEVQTDSPTN